MRRCILSGEWVKINSNWVIYIYNIFISFKNVYFTKLILQSVICEEIIINDNEPNWRFKTIMTIKFKIPLNGVNLCNTFTKQLFLSNKIPHSLPILYKASQLVENVMKVSSLAWKLRRNTLKQKEWKWLNLNNSFS